MINEEKQWLRHLLPLPHGIAIEDKVTCHPTEISIHVRREAGAIERQAVTELEQLFIEKAGGVPTGEAFRIVIGVVDTKGIVDNIAVDQQRLRSLPNREQAYIIQPEGKNTLVLTGLNERGVYYAVTTLYQLLAPVMSADCVSMPLVRVIDWPDMDERGLWNFPKPESWMPWMASLKLNYGKMASTTLQKVEREQRNRVAIDRQLLQESQLKGFNYLPYILHLNFLHDCGLFQAYPELAGKGDGALAGRYFAHKHGNQHRVPCASNPLLVDILTEWMADIASQGAKEVSCWLSERPAQCGCTACTAVGQFVLEARAFVMAWQLVRKQYLHFQIRIFLSTTTTDRNYRVLAELPPEVKIERACATALERVLHLPRDLMRNPLLDHYASQGRWIASYDVPIGANGRVDTPEFKLPHRSAHRIKDYVAQLIGRNYSGAYGMMAWGTMGLEICGFNVQALAEWSWNLNGRSEKEFAIAWAIREGYRQPEVVGEWAELIGPVEFDVYDSDFPICYSWGRAVEMVQKRKRPYLGEGMFRYYASVEDFDRQKAACEHALQLVSEEDTRDLAHETRVVLSYVELARHIYQVAEKVSTLDLTDVANQKALGESIDNLKQSGAENIDAIRAWRDGLGPEPWHYRVHDALQGTQSTVDEISRFVAEQYFN